MPELIVLDRVFIGADRVVMGAFSIDTSGGGSGFASGITGTVNKASIWSWNYSHSDDRIFCWQMGAQSRHKCKALLGQRLTIRLKEQILAMNS